MSLIGLILALAFLGVILYFLPADDRIKRLIVALAAIAVVIWLLGAFGLYHSWKLH